MKLVGCKAMEVNGTAQNNDESNFSGNQTLEPSDDQGSMMVSNESQNVSGDSAFSVSDSSSNMNNTLNSEPNVSNVLNESGLSDADALLIQSPKLLKNANVASPSSGAKGPASANTNNDDSDSTISGSFLKNLFEINGPTSRSINELLKEYPYLPYYSLFSLLTASTGRESVERMLEWLHQLQARQVATTEGSIKNKEYYMEKQNIDAFKSDDDKTQLSARAGISPNGSATQITSVLSKCQRVLAIAIAVLVIAIVCLATSLFGGVCAIIMAGIITTSALIGIGFAVNAIVNKVCKSTSTRAKLKEIFDLLNIINAAAEIIVLVVELFTDDEEKLKLTRLITRIIFAIIFIVLMFLTCFMSASVVATIVTMISGLASGIAQIVQAAYDLHILEEQKNVAKKRFELETAIAYCEKLQKDLDIIASEIDMIVELFTAAMDRIRAEYDRISRMIKETSDVKNMIARNIGA